MNKRERDGGGNLLNVASPREPVEPERRPVYPTFRKVAIQACTALVYGVIYSLMAVMAVIFAAAVTAATLAWVVFVVWAVFFSPVYTILTGDPAPGHEILFPKEEGVNNG